MSYASYKKLIQLSKDKEEYQRLLQERNVEWIALPLSSKNMEPLMLAQHQAITDYILKIEDAYAHYHPIMRLENLANEVFATCVIEGALVTLDDTIALVQGKPARSKSEKMIRNSLRATRFIHNEDICAEAFDEQALINLWQLIIHEACDDIHLMGDKYRNQDMTIVDTEMRATYQAPDPALIQPMMDALITFLHSNPLHPFLAAIVVHYYCAYIQPFSDGNGRLGRLLLKQYLVSKGYDKFNALPLTNHVLNRLKDYYAALEDTENDCQDVTCFVLYYLETIHTSLVKQA